MLPVVGPTNKAGPTDVAVQGAARDTGEILGVAPKMAERRKGFCFTAKGAAEAAPSKLSPTMLTTRS